MLRIELNLLGPFRARSPSGEVLRLPTRKAQALLAYLALRSGQRHAREELAALLWGDVGEQHARESFRHALSAIRKIVGGRRGLLADRGVVVVSPSAVRVDVSRFERLAAKLGADGVGEAGPLLRCGLSA